jgi:4-hydroxy-tetrahydrodipicolinate reductase
MKRVLLFGGGRMGRQVANTLRGHPRAKLGAVVSLNRPDWLKGVPWCADPGQLDEQPDLLIDFSLPGGTRAAANWCRANLVPMVSGTTGLDEADREALNRAAELIPVLWAPNLSRGINILLLAAAETAAALPADTAVEIIDIHHVHKQDSPSGTALMIAHAIAAARGQDIDDRLVIGGPAEGLSPEPGSIHCISYREGEVIGEHRVRFLCAGEQVVLSHSATERGIYAAGAVEAGLWLVDQQAGLYSAANWLGA